MFCAQGGLISVVRAFAGVALAVGALLATDVRADSTMCSSDMSGATLGSVDVPAGTECDLSNATVNGNIYMQAGSVLAIYGNVTVTGNISGLGSRIVEIYNGGTGSNEVVGNVTIDSNDTAFICGSRIDGNIAISNSYGLEVAFGGSEPGAACSRSGGGNVVGGTVSIANNKVTFFRAADNVVSKNMTILDNIGLATKRVLNNTVTGNLTCSDNDPPFIIGGNHAAKLIGQCKP
jgi:hypothetical protein